MKMFQDAWTGPEGYPVGRPHRWMNFGIVNVTDAAGLCQLVEKVEIFTSLP
jgi:hypothetical protein